MSDQTVTVSQPQPCTPEDKKRALAGRSPSVTRRIMESMEVDSKTIIENSEDMAKEKQIAQSAANNLRIQCKKKFSVKWVDGSNKTKVIVIRVE